MKLSKKLLNYMLPFLLIASFTLFGCTSLYSIRQLQGDARVINYAGLVRGATQRLIKQEMNHVKNDELIIYLETLLNDLQKGGGEYELTALKSDDFQSCILRMQEAWPEIVEEIENVRAGGDSGKLYQMSEVYFQLADQAVSAAELHSESKVKRTAFWILALNLVLVLSVIAFWIVNRMQKSTFSALQAAENASREKSEFLSRMSHEIRTPMNGIIGMTEIARMSIHDPEKTLDCLNKIALSSDYLLSLINDILDMSRIESGKFALDIRPFSLEELKDRIFVIFRQKAEDAGIHFTVELEADEPCELKGDELRLSQVVVNLVSNALKFTPRDGSVNVWIIQERMPDGQVQLKLIVKDTGIGMSEEFKRRMYAPFEQADSSTVRQYGGTGLGLSISYNLIRLMGGNIELESELGKGSCFTISLKLPVSQKEAKEEHEALPVIQEIVVTKEKEIAVSFSGIHVLLVEDNEINGEIAGALMDSIGITYEHAWNGKEAVEVFTSSPPSHFDLILMDVQMPVMDGLEACRRIRGSGHSGAETIPVVGLSANAFDQDVRRALDSGMTAYLSKPFTVVQLARVIQGLMPEVHADGGRSRRQQK